VKNEMEATYLLLVVAFCYVVLDLVLERLRSFLFRIKNVSIAASDQE